MLSISSAQSNLLSGVMRSKAAEQLISHVQTHFSQPARLAGETAVHKLVEGCFADADVLGLADQQALMYLLSLQLYFGSGFRHDRLLSDFTAILERSDVATPRARIGRCWREGLAFHDQIAGAQGQHAGQAIARLAGLELAGLAADNSALEAGQVDYLLASIWPEKYAQLRLRDPAAFAGLMVQLGALAQRHAIRKAGGARVLLALAWVFGAGFADDAMLEPLGALLRPDVSMNPASMAAADVFLARIVEAAA